MDSRRWRFAEDYAGSVFTSAYLDSATYVSADQHPSVVVASAVDLGTFVDVSGETLVTDVLPADIQDRVVAPGSSFAVIAKLVVAGTGSLAGVSFSTTARQVRLDLTGIFETGPLYDVADTRVEAASIHRGGIATVAVDGVVQATVDLYKTAVWVPLYLDGNRHTITIARTGTYNTEIDPATVAADPPMLGIVNARFWYVTGGSPTWYSAVLDSGSDDTLWQHAEWTQNVPPGAVFFDVGSAPDPVADAAWWQFQSTSDILTRTLDSGTQIGLAGLARLPVARGRYARLGLAFPGAAAVVPFVRDIALYSWVPERDPVLMSKLALAEHWTPGQTFGAFLGALAALAADSRTAALDFIAGLTPAGAVDALLRAYGADVGLPQYTGEGPLSYRRRILAALRSRDEGGSLAFIQEQVALLTGFATSSIGATTTGSTLSYQISVPPPVALPDLGGAAGYPGLPGLSVASAQQIIADLVTTVLRPVTGRPTVVFG